MKRFLNVQIYHFIQNIDKVGLFADLPARVFDIFMEK